MVSQLSYSCLQKDSHNGIIHGELSVLLPKLMALPEAELFRQLSHCVRSIKKYSHDVFLAKTPVARRMKQMKRENAEEWQAELLDCIEQLNHDRKTIELDAT